MSKQIVMSCDRLGNVKVDAVGFVGNTCEGATKAYVQALNAGKADESKKPEYGLPASTGNTVGSRW